MARTAPSTPPESGDPSPSDSIDPQEDRQQSRFAALAYRNYRLFFFGQLISVTGTWMQSLAQSYLVYDVLDASPFQLGLVNVFQFAPVLLLGIPAGVIADRFPKRTLLVITQSTFALLAAALAILVSLDHVQLWQVYLIAGLFGITNALDMPTRQSFVPELIGKHALMNAIALNSTMFNTGRVIGPAIAGIVLAAFGPVACFTINAISYGGVITGLLLMKVAPIARAQVGSAASRLREGVDYVRSTPAIYRTIILVGALGTFGMNFNVWVPMLASDSFESGAGTYGILFSAMGLGSLCGALTLAMFGRSPNRRRMLGAVIVLGAVEVGIAVTATIPTAVIAGAIGLAIAGFLSSTAMATANTSVQTVATSELRGRVMAVYMTVFAGSTPIGALLSGAIADRFGIPIAIGFGGFATLIAAVAIAWVQRERLAPPLEHKVLGSP
jgi:MFS family permease